MVGHVVEVEEVGVVEEGHRAGVGHDALLEVIAEAATEVTAKHKVEILTMETEVRGSVGSGDFAVGTDLQFELVEHLAPLHLGVGTSGDEQHKCCCCQG